MRAGLTVHLRGRGGFLLEVASLDVHFAVGISHAGGYFGTGGSGHDAG